MTPRALGSLAVLLLAPVARAQVDPDAKALMEEMARAHFALQSYSGQVTVRATSSKREERATATVEFQRPGKARVAVTRGAQTTLSVTDGAGRYLRIGEKERTVKAEKENVAIKETLVSAEVFISPVFYWVSTEPDSADKLLPGTVTRMGRGTDLILDGVACDVVAAEVAAGGGTARLTFAIGHADHLLRRVTVVATRGNETLNLTESYTDVRANPTLAETRFTLPPRKKSP